MDFLFRLGRKHPLFQSRNWKIAAHSRHVKQGRPDNRRGTFKLHSLQVRRPHFPFEYEIIREEESSDREEGSDPG